MCDLDKPFIKGKSFTLQGTLNQDITDWKIRCEIYDSCGHSIKLATENSDGSDDQIQVTDLLTGTFIVKVEADTTTDFDNNANIEIEVETTTLVGTKNEKLSILSSEIKFKKGKINWESPS